MKQMTKNEYKEYMKECASKLYNVPGYTMKDYNEELDNVKILPFNLSAFPALKDITRERINRFFSEEDKDKEGNYMLRGFTHHEGTEMIFLGLFYGDFSDALNFFAYNNEELFLYTYCEGDTTLTLFPDKESYEKGYNVMYEWYKKNFESKYAEITA